MMDKKINQEQKKAIEHKKGPLLIIAGAGTGKTTVITERIKHLISTGKVKPEQILALTFTDKAAREMQERVDIALPYGYTDMWISTFHSFCDRVLRQQAVHIGLDSNYKLMSGAEETQFLTDNLFKFDLQYFRPLGNPTKFVEGMLQHFSRLHDEDITPGQYLEYATQKIKKATEEVEESESEKVMELAKAYQTYENLKASKSRMDFADLTAKTIELFRKRKNILNEYRQKFLHILVDEFQDTNLSQYVLVKLLAPAENNPDLSVVGDDSQSIYRFRGAAIANILQFMKDYPKAKQVVLNKNYRSNQKILDSSYRLIKNNDPDTLEARLKIDKNLLAVREIKNFPVEFIYRSRVENEAEAVAQKIIKLREINGLTEKYQYKDFAILLRANNQSEAFTRALARLGIPYQFLGPGQLFRQPEIKDLIAYLKVLYDFTDNVALHRVLSMPIFEVSSRDIAAINNFARKQNLSLFEACEQIEQIFVSDNTKEKVNKIIQMINRHLDLLEKETAGQITYFFLEDTGLLQKYAEVKLISEEKQIKNISQFFDRLKTYEVEHEDASVKAVVDWIILSMNLGESPLASNTDWVEEDKVNLLTVHSAKGLEFPVVFLVNLIAGRFPTYDRHEQIPIPEDLIKEDLPEGDYHLQEERRLFYVGMTRAKDRLFFTAAGWYGEGKRERKISPFVLEALEEVDTSLKKEENEQLSFLNCGKIEELSKDEKIKENQSVNFLSYSQIELFNTCPLQYRYRYIQRIPTPPSSALTFGDCIHRTLKDFYQLIKEGQKPDKQELLLILNKTWQSNGFSNKTQEEKTKKAGQEMLSRFYDSEKPFRAPLTLEQPFLVKIAPELKFGGKIDRVDQIGERLEIIDYKTGKVMEQKEVDKSLQMTAYGLAATDPGTFNKKPQQVMLTFYFLDSGEKKSTTRSRKQLETAKKEIQKKAKEIFNSKFLPTPGFHCDFCNYRMICEAWK